MLEQTKVHIEFDYYPDEPDMDSPTGMSEEEYVRLMDRLRELGVDSVEWTIA